MPKSSALRGKVIAHNISPKGFLEGVLLDTASGTVQVNLSKEPHDHESSSKAFALGSTVTPDVELENDEDGDHVVYKLANATGAASGRIARLNYARHGEVNGYHLDDATFVHVKPDGHAKYKLKVGDQITTAGGRHLSGAVRVIEPDSITKLSGGASREGSAARRTR